MPNQTKSKHRVTLGKIAEMAGVSKCAVSLALKGSRKISEAVRKKIKRVADANGYRGSALLSTVMSPPWARAKPREIVRPRPVPPALRVIDMSI